MRGRAAQNSDVLRLADSLAFGRDQSWVLGVNPTEGPTLPPVEWLTSIRIRQRVSLMAQKRPCAGCGSEFLDIQCMHSLCCARGESARGHNCVRARYGALRLIFREVDPKADTEVHGLAPGRPDLRPTDVLTRSAHFLVRRNRGCPDQSTACKRCSARGRPHRRRQTEKVWALPG